MAKLQGAPPVLLLSHGTTMLTGEQSLVRDYWNFHGDKALEYPVKGIIMMVNHYRPKGSMDLFYTNTIARVRIGRFQGARYTLQLTPIQSRNLWAWSKNPNGLIISPIQTYQRHNGASRC
jgi:hypothetical protein